MISLKQLSYILAVEKTLHFRRAAELCHVSQSALSTAINEFETQLGLQVFERDNRKVLITPVGKEVLARAKMIMLGVTDLHDLAEGQKAPLSYPISVGVIPTIAPYLLPKVLPPLRESYPDAQINIVEEQSAALVEKVQSGELDTAILALPYPCEGLLTMEFWAEDFYWISARVGKHVEQNEITSHELAESKLMLLQDGHCLKDHILDVCKFTDVQNNHEFGATSLSTLVQLVKGNLGTTLIPAMAMDQLLKDDPNLAAVHLNEPSPHRRIAFIIRPNYTRPQCIDALKRVCTEAFCSPAE